MSTHVSLCLAQCLSDATVQCNRAMPPKMIFPAEKQRHEDSEKAHSKEQPPRKRKLEVDTCACDCAEGVILLGPEDGQATYQCQCAKCGGGQCKILLYEVAAVFSRMLHGGRVICGDCRDVGCESTFVALARIKEKKVGGEQH